VLSAVRKTLREHAMVEPGMRVLVGLSGGADSWATLLALQHHARALGLEICAGVVDHGLRPDSQYEAAAVQKACRARGVSCVVSRVEVDRYRAPGVSVQDAARRARLERLSELASDERCARVALGHNADDQAETVLFRIFRGTGLRGLAGIPYVRLPFIRPLLDVGRQAIEAYTLRSGVPVVEDPSNADPRYSRVRIRHKWLPLLGQENPRIAEALLGLAREAQRMPTHEGVQSNSGGDFRSGQPFWAHRNAARSIAQLVDSGQGTRRVSVMGGSVEVRYGRVRFMPRDLPSVGQPSGRSRAAWLDLRITGPGTYDLGSASLTVRPESPFTQSESTSPEAVSAVVTEEMFSGGHHQGDDPERSPERTAVFDRAQLRWPLAIRGWKPGDRMRPRGGVGRRKLQDIFVDAKIPKPERHQLPVFVDSDGDILWVPGLRPAEKAKPSARTGQIVRLMLDPADASR